MGALVLRSSVTPGGSTDPYPWYTSFDRNGVPWHTASGGWGPQVVINAPYAPVTTSSSNVTSVAEFNAAAAIDGREITITTGWSGNSVATISASDVDVIINPGVSIGAIEAGFHPRTTPIARIRVRGPTLGSKSGGQMGMYRDVGQAIAGGITDVIFDGIDMNGDSNFGGTETNIPFRIYATRVSITNCRVVSAGSLWLGEATDVFIGNCNMFHGACTRADASIAAWGIRNMAGPVTVVDSKIRGTRYHNFRTHPKTGNVGQVCYVKNTDLVAQSEGKTAWLWTQLDGETDTGDGAILDGCNIYTYDHASCTDGFRSLDADGCTYSRVQNCNFYGDGDAVWSQALLNTQEAAGGGSPGDHDWSVGNTFTTWATYPAWGSIGDPLSIPLPSGLSYSSGEGFCVAFVE